ncbi:unnamed protein product [Prunus armeniaca]|uniref:Uncharacterized protein n=1 Tax=Prunus armeniaca TaxID=36596 RepID=A0A6J5TF18_PRUAR|nr:unnamed protein product [Prunus armeniaca]
MTNIISTAAVGNERTHSGRPPRSPKSVRGRDAQCGSE